MRFKAMPNGMSLDEAMRAVDQAGGRVDRQLKVLNVLLGEIDDARFDGLCGIEGLIVEPDEVVKVEPPCTRGR